MHQSFSRKVWFDMEADGKPLGRIVIGLYENKVPITCANFRALAIGHNGLTYTGSNLFWIDNLGVYGGDFQYNNGRGGYSIYGTKFKDEDLTRTHDKPGLVCMANRGLKDANGSQFIITLQKRPDLDYKNVIFGEVTSGLEVVQSISKTYGSVGGTPRSTVKIARAGAT